MKRKRKKQSTQKSYTCKIFGLIVAITVIAVSGGILLKRTITESPENTLMEYMNHIEKKEYEVMYTMIDSDEKVYLTKEEYIQRNSKIYEGIEVSDIKISHVTVKEKKADTVTLSYETSCNTIAGTIQFDNMAELKKTKVLALVSTPSYDNNEFIRGLSSEKWTSLNEDEKKPLYNRFRQVWCPGSTFKPVVAGIGLKTESIDPKEDFGNEGLAWQKDSSWGSYQVTTLHEYEPVIMKNAIIYSDNIYFAKAALKIGSENFMNTLNEIGFNQNMPFEIAMQESTYSNTDKIETEIQLADSGYGQGQILVNPLHLASIYTSFLNEGNMIKPYLKYKEEASGETWIENAFSKENVEEIMQGVEGVVNDPEGTGYAAHRDDILLAGKTGTAELKATKEDTSGKEIGWFSVFTADKSVDKPILLISMVENVKGIGGSGYVVKKDATVLEEYFEK